MPKFFFPVSSAFVATVLLVAGVSPARANTGAPAPQPQTVNNGQASGSGTSGNLSPVGQDQQKNGFCGANGRGNLPNITKGSQDSSGGGDESLSNSGCNSFNQTSNQTMSPEQRQKMSNWMQANPNASSEAVSNFASSIGISLSNDSASWASANNSQALKVLTGGASADGGKVLFAPTTIDNSTYKVEAVKIPVGQQLLPHLPVGQRSWVVQEADCNGVVTTTSLVDGNTAWNFGLGLPFASIGGGRSKPESIEIQAKERKLMRLKAYSATFGNIDRTGASQTTKSHIAKTAAIFGDESPEKVAAASEIEFTDGRSACQSVPPKGNTPPPSQPVAEIEKMCVAKGNIFVDFFRKKGSVELPTGGVITDPKNCGKKF